MMKKSTLKKSISLFLISTILLFNTFPIQVFSSKENTSILTNENHAVVYQHRTEGYKVRYVGLFGQSA